MYSPKTVPAGIVTVCSALLAASVKEKLPAGTPTCVLIWNHTCAVVLSTGASGAKDEFGIYKVCAEINAEIYKIIQ